MAGRKLCCCRISTWAMIVSWINIIFNVMYIIFLILSLLGLLGGPDNLRVLIRQNPDKYPSYYRLLEYTYEYLVFYLFLLVVYNVLGIPLNIILLRAALMRNERKILIWLYHHFCNIIILFPYLMWKFIAPDAITNSLIRVIANYSYSFFSFWCVYSLLRELRYEKADIGGCYSFEPTVLMVNETPEPLPERPFQLTAPPSPRSNDRFADYNLT